MALCILTAASKKEQMKEVNDFFLSLKTDEEKEKAEKAPEELVAFLTLVMNDFSVAFKKAEPAGLLSFSLFFFLPLFLSFPFFFSLLSFFF